MSTNEKGFSTVEILLIIIAFGIVGGTGWYVYRAQQDKPVITDTPKTSEAKNSKSSTGQATTDSNTSADITPALESVVSGIGLIYTSEDKKFSTLIPDGWDIFATKGYDLIYSWGKDGIQFNSGQPATVTTIEGGRDGTSMAFYMSYGTDKPSYSHEDLKKVRTYNTTNQIVVDEYTRTQTKEPEGMDLPVGTTEYLYDLSSNGGYIRIIHDVLKGETEQTKHIKAIIESTKFL